MKIQSSYIFLKKEHKGKPKKKAITDKSIVFNVGENIYSYIKESFPNIKKNTEASNPFKREYYCTKNIEDVEHVVKFATYEVTSTTYLDIIVEGKSKAKIIKCLQFIQKTLFDSEIREHFIDILSYDAISEYYCNKIYPKLNTLERNLRKLLFNIYIVNFGKNYYQETIDQNLQEKIKGLIKAKGNIESKEIQRMQHFFYSFEFSDIQKMLFTPSWTKIEDKQRTAFLSKHEDLSQLSDQELRTFIHYNSPKSDWERFFSDKISDLSVEKTIEDIRKYRNSIAHFKFFYKEDYEKCLGSINKLNRTVNKAIKLTEEIDFTKKNQEQIISALSRVSEWFKENDNALRDAIKPSLQKFAETISQVINQIKVNFNPVFNSNYSSLSSKDDESIGNHKDTTEDDNNH